MTHETGNARLLQLADHLESDRRLLQRFDFHHICHLDPIDPIERPLGDRSTGVHPCGTSGCAMGEMPALWPDEWAFTGNVSAIQLANPATVAELKDQGSTLLLRRLQSSAAYVDEDIRCWFEIDDDAFIVLFHPYSEWDVTGADKLELSNGETLVPLPGKATASQVAQQIRTFVAHRPKEHA